VNLETTISSTAHASPTVRLTLKDEAGANLVAGLVQLLGIKGAANAKGQAAVDLGVVGEGRNTGVVELGLHNHQ
jgi:hypothetical protein